ncbi:MAG TPA: efflux RND transporter periplasmic adaptor subunit [Candidatus Eisenbacteria bacterium]|nr:efflux RND transporter periplasmic adaptor subunit [Candidatus Eisenbacteria bacterium]
MNLIKSSIAKISSAPSVVKIVCIVVLVVAGYIGYMRFFASKSNTQQYQTAQVTRDTLVVSVSESGAVAVANRQPVTTGGSGVVTEVDVATGDRVEAGQVIAKVALDTTSQQKQAAAWASYLSAKNTLASAQNQMNTLQATLFQANQAFVKDRGVINPSIDQQNDPVYIEENATWLAAENNYKNQQQVIAAAESNVTSAWLSYQQLSGEIVAPISGTIIDLTITPGMQITAPTSTTTVSSQTVASIKSDGNPVIGITLSEIDATKVKAGQKATVTFDAFPNKTFTGKVLGINTTGSVSSGVTSYPATIVLDGPNDDILPNMSATANIIILVRPDVLLVPSSAVQTNGGQATVRVLENNKPVNVDVTVGESSDTQTEIVSGLTEGQTIITGTIAPTTTTSSTSPFGGGLRGGFGGGNATFIRTGGGGGAGRAVGN